MKAEPVTFFEKEYYMLSNWSAHAIVVDGVEYKTVDHAYHAAKFDDPKIKLKISSASSPLMAKQVANDFLHLQKELTQDEKVEIMKKLNTIKANQHKEVSDALIKSANAEIIEDSPFDDFWGIGANGKGRNELGKIWMEIREQILSSN